MCGLRRAAARASADVCAAAPHPPQCRTYWTPDQWRPGQYYKKPYYKPEHICKWAPCPVKKNKKGVVVRRVGGDCCAYTQWEWQQSMEIEAIKRHQEALALWAQQLAGWQEQWEEQRVPEQPLALAARPQATRPAAVTPAQPWRWQVQAGSAKPQAGGQQQVQAQAGAAKPQQQWQVQSGKPQTATQQPQFVPEAGAAKPQQMQVESGAAKPQAAAQTQGVVAEAGANKG